MLGRAFRDFKGRVVNRECRGWTESRWILVAHSRREFKWISFWCVSGDPTILKHLDDCSCFFSTAVQQVNHTVHTSKTLSVFVVIEIVQQRSLFFTVLKKKRCCSAFLMMWLVFSIQPRSSEMCKTCVGQGQGALLQHKSLAWSQVSRGFGHQDCGGIFQASVMILVIMKMVLKTASMTFTCSLILHLVLVLSCVSVLQGLQ